MLQYKCLLNGKEQQIGGLSEVCRDGETMTTGIITSQADQSELRAALRRKANAETSAQCGDPNAG